MNTLRNITLMAVSILLTVAAFMGLATLGLVFLSVIFVGSVFAIGFAAWEKRSTITTTYSVVE